MKRGSRTGRLPVGNVTKLLPGGRRRRIPGLGAVTRHLPGGGGVARSLPGAKNLPGGRAVGAASGVLLGAGAAVAAGKALTGRRNGRDPSGRETPKTENAEDTGSGTTGDKGEADTAASAASAASGEDAAAGNGHGVLGRLKDTVGGAVPGLGEDGGGNGRAGGKGDGSGGGAKVKVTDIVEHIDIGAPRRLVYDQWTRFQDYPSFMKKVVSVDQESQEKLNWKAKIFWSSRTWESTIVEQVPDDHIVWRSKGPKGHVDGTVSFHELSPNLTRVLLVLEYHPQGFFERTGNLWRAQGRRVRLELKHFRRHVMTRSLTHADEIEGWRGEIRDSEVVRTHEEALEEEGHDRARDDGNHGSGERESGKRKAGKRGAEKREAEEVEAAR